MIYWSHNDLQSTLLSVAFTSIKYVSIGTVWKLLRRIHLPLHIMVSTCAIFLEAISTNAKKLQYFHIALKTSFLQSLIAIKNILKTLYWGYTFSSLHMISNMDLHHGKLVILSIDSGWIYQHGLQTFLS